MTRGPTSPAVATPRDLLGGLSSIRPVNQGVREVGIRMALGARGSNIVRHYVRQSLTPVLIGVAVGLGVGG